MKSATVFHVLLVALLLLLPAPAVAAPLTTPQQADKADAPPTPTPEVTPTPEPTSGAEALSPVTDLHATAGRLRGRVEVGWSVSPAVGETNQAGSVFVVERSTNGSSWRPVKACYVPFDGAVHGYGCTDVRLASGTTYAYRVCLAGKPTSCSNALTTDPVAVKAP